MQPPRIHYAITSDGVGIAYAVSGSGPVLISVPAPPDNHIQLEWEMPEGRESIERISAHCTLVRYDGRGTGLSQRDVADVSLQARVADLEAVADRLGVERFSLMSGSLGVQVVIAYAAAHPERVTHVVAVNPFIKGSEFLAAERRELFSRILQADYRLFTDTIGAETFGWGREEGVRYGQFFRDCVRADMAIHLYNAMVLEDLTHYLPAVRCPVLVVRFPGQMESTPESASRFAAALPRATFTVLGDRSPIGSTAQLRQAVAGFLGEQWPEPDAAPTAHHAEFAGTLRTLLFTDLVGHASMMSRLGDARGRAVLREHEQITREALAAHGGAEVKAMGDGFMASFGSAQKALECAVAIQRAFTHSPVLGPEAAEGLQVRVGVNAGEPIAEDDDLFGASVIAASRIAARAAGGQVLVADVVRQLVAGKGFLFADTGNHDLKGLEDPVRIWELRWEDAG